MAPFAQIHTEKPLRRAQLWILVGLWSVTTVQAQSDNASIAIETDLGTVLVELYQDRAPLTVENFLRYVEGGHYEGGSFFRTVTDDNQPDNDVLINVIQAGIHPWKENFEFEPIRLETTDMTGVLHVDGAISMARSQPNSASSSFFICVGDQPELDFGGRRNPDGQGFAAFGKVTYGMEVVRKIHAAAAQGQALVPTISIVRILDVPVSVD